MATSPYSPAEAALMQQGLQANLPQTYPYIQRSQYLADALQKLSGESQTIRSPGALAANLGSELLLQLGRKRADKQLLAATQAARQQQANMLLGNLGPDPSAQPDTPAASPSPAASPGAPPVNPSSVTPASFTPSAPSMPAPPMTQPMPPAPTDPKLQAMAALISGGMKPPNAAGLVGNFQQESGPNLGADNPSEGAIGAANWRGSRAQALKDYAAKHGGDPRSLQTQMAFALEEGNGPEAGAFSRINAATTPEDAATAAFGYERPQGWTPNGDPMAVSAAQQRINNARAVLAAYQAQNPGAQTPQAQPPAASQGPAPSAPMGAPPVPAMGGAAPMQPPGPQQFMNHGPSATPQERALVQSLLANPATYQQGVALAQKLAEQYAARPSVGQGGGFYGSDGQYHSTNQMQTVQSGPAGGIQQNILTGENKPYSNPNVGSLPAGTAATFGGPGGTAQIAPIANQGVQDRPLTPDEIKQRGLPPGFAGTINPITGEIKAQEQGYGPQQVLALQDRVAKSAEYQSAQEASKAYSAMVGLAQQAQGGMRAYALRDTFARVINPGAVARVGTIQAIKEAQGIPENIKSFLLNIQGDGDVSPAIVQQIIDAARPFAQAQWQSANSLNQNNADFAQRHGLDPRDVMAPLPPPPQRYVVQQPHPQPQAQPNQPQPMVQPPPQPQAQRRPGVRVFNAMTGQLE